MAKLVVSQFVTTDMVFEDPGGSESLDRGGWAFQFDRGPEGDKFKLDELMAADALLLGRVTFEGFAAAWPSREGEFADKFNGMAKYVVSSTLTDPEWNNTTVIRPDELAARVGELRERPGGDVLVNGSAQLLRALMDHDLVDESRLVGVPGGLAERRPVCPERDSAQLQLPETKPAGECVILIYAPRR